MTSGNENVAFILTLFIAQSLLGVLLPAQHLTCWSHNGGEEIHPDSVDGLLFVHGLKH